MIHHQLGIAAYLKLINLHGVGEVKPDNDSFIFDFAIGGLEPKSECIFHVDPIRGGQNQPCTAALSIGSPI